MTPLYIFDLDGTLADLRHRRPLVELQDGSPVLVQGTPGVFRGNHETIPYKVWVEFPVTGRWVYHISDVKFQKNWEAFYAACTFDKPAKQVIHTLRILHTYADVWIWTGRKKTVRIETVDWLNEYVCSASIAATLQMRPANDFTPDDQLKESWLHAMHPEDRARLVAVFDDRDRVVAMWRRNGVQCFQAAPGDF